MGKYRERQHRLVEVISEAGISFTFARTWEGEPYDGAPAEEPSRIPAAVPAVPLGELAMSGLKWPALPTRGRTVRLPFGCPPQLVELSGYDGAGRLVAMWWTPLGDELMLADGTITATGDYRGLLAFCAHPLSRLFLNP